MAESDAAGPGIPGGPKSRALTREEILAAVEREWATLTPEEKAQRKAESEKADREAFEEASRAMRPTLEALERMADSARRAMGQIAEETPPGAKGFGLAYEPPAGIVHEPLDYARFEIEPAQPLTPADVRQAVADGVREALAEASPKPAPDSGRTAAIQPGGLFTGGAAWPAGQAALFVAQVMQGLETGREEQPPASAQRPPFELDPSKRLLDALREAFPSFTPTDQWWSHVERELINAHKRSNPEGHDDFRAAYWHWSADDLVRHLETTGRIVAKPKGRKRKRTVEGLDVHQWLMAMAVKDPSIRYLSEREAAKLGPFSARCIGGSWVWKQWKKDLKAEADEAAERAAAELANRHGEDEDGNGFRLSSTKHGTGIQRAAPEDLEHDRAVEDFLSKAGQARRKRNK